MNTNLNIVRFCRSAVVIFTSIVLGSSISLAQVNVPFQVTAGSGILAQLPSPASPVQSHSITVGTVAFNGQTMNYTGTGSVRALGAIDPATGQAPFDSAVPFLFDFGSGDTLRFQYGHPELGAPSTGIATVAPLPSGSADVTWLATFNPVPGSGTGKFANVIGGGFLMTAKQFAIDLAGTKLPYTWTSNVGFLTVVPEPGTSLLAVLGACALLVVRRARQ